MNKSPTNIKLPSFLLEGDFAKISKRFYSICNDPFKEASKPNTIKLLFTRHTFKIEDEIRQGHCSQYLADFALNKSLSFSIGLIGRVLKLPNDTANLLIIAQGTGIAPFLSILDRILYSENHKTSTKVKMVYGVRDNHANMIHKANVENFFASQSESEIEGKTQHELVVACSRDIDEGQNSTASNISYERGYVQDCISKLDLSGINYSNTHVLICGNKNALGGSALRALPFEQDQID